MNKLGERLDAVDLGEKPSGDLLCKCHSNLDAIILWRYAIGDTPVKVPKEMISPSEMQSLIDRHFKVKTCWYVAYEPGYQIEW